MISYPNWIPCFDEVNVAINYKCTLSRHRVKRGHLVGELRIKISLLLRLNHIVQLRHVLVVRIILLSTIVLVLRHLALPIMPIPILYALFIYQLIYLVIIQMVVAPITRTHLLLILLLVLNLYGRLRTNSLRLIPEAIAGTWAPSCSAMQFFSIMSILGETVSGV